MSKIFRGTGYCLRYVCFFLHFFVSKITTKWLDRFAWNFHGRCGVTMGRFDNILVNSEKPRVARCRDAQHRGRGLLCFRTTACLFLSFFVCFFVSKITTNGWTDLHEIFRKGVEWPRDDLIKFRVNLGKWVGGSKVNLLSPDIATWFDCCLPAVLCCHLANENVMKLLFLAFCCITTRGGLCCASRHRLFGITSETRSVGYANWYVQLIGYVYIVSPLK